ncbi:MAG: autotransporter domain-containing protein, partial [Christensenellaceae bacterium]|nr:autotransporter domain-containing protein [Christensenellaceae bacterium]
DFAGTYKQSAGKTLVSGTYFTGISSITNASILEFTGDQAKIIEGSKLGIWSSTMIITSEVGELKFTDDMIFGDGTIIKNNDAQMFIEGDNSKFTGFYKQTGGELIVSSKAFNALHYIKNAAVELATGAFVSNSSTKFVLSNASKMNITADNALVLGIDAMRSEDKISSINKTGTGQLLITGDNSAFVGEFLQTSGTTTVTGDGVYFSGINLINGSWLEITNGGLIKGGQIVGNGATIKGAAAKVDISISDENTVAFKALGFSILEFNRNSTINIENTKQAFYIEKSSLTFESSTIKLSSNSAINENGGAVFSDTLLKISNGIMSFYNNLAKNGGAIYAGENSQNYISGSGNFKNNTSLSKGGAIYVAHGSTATISASYNGNIVFENNVANGIANDIFLEGKTHLNLVANGSLDKQAGDIFIYGGIETSNDDDIEINKSGQGTVELHGNLKFNGNLEIQGGILDYRGNAANIAGDINIDVGTLNYYGSSLNIENLNISVAGFLDLKRNSIINGGIISNARAANSFIYENRYEVSENIINNGSLNFCDNNQADHVIVGGKFENNFGEVSMDIFSSADGTPLCNDSITASEVDINGGTIIVKPAAGKYVESTYTLINATDYFDDAGGFDNFRFDDKYLSIRVYGLDLIYPWDEFGVENSLILKVSLLVKNDLTEFAKTYNQKQVATILGELSSSNNPIAEIIKESIDIANSQKNDSAVQNLLTETSGYFLANVIRAATDDNINKEIYDKILVDEHQSNNVWLQTTGGQVNLKSDANSVSPYRATNYGAVFGLNGWRSKDFTLGFFTKYKKNDISQGLSKATINALGGGVYFGMSVTDKFELKTLVEGTHNSINSQRVINYRTTLLENNKTVSNFSGLLLTSDVEFSVKKIGICAMIFQPYIGSQYQSINYTKLEEFGAVPLALEGSDVKYERHTIRIGGKLRYGNGSAFSWYGLSELKYLVNGNISSLGLHIRDTDIEFKSTGFEEPNLVAGIGMGMSFNISESTKFYANGNYYGGKNYENYIANIGLKLNFSNLFSNNKTK